MTIPEKTIKTLYHYCSNSAFAAIVESKSIHLSLLSLANDTMEGRLVSEAIMRLADRHKLEPYSKERLKDSLNNLEEFFDGLGFCLSEECDLLSQWRGYADGARGVSIGFSKEYLEKLAKISTSEKIPGFGIYKIEYDEKVHDETVEPTFNELLDLINQGAFRSGLVRGLLAAIKTNEEIEDEIKIQSKAFEKLNFKIIELFPKLFELKKNAFKEEKEWRLVSLLTQGLDANCRMRGAPDRITPYRSFDLIGINQTPAIHEVIIGPKNLTPPKIIKLMLKKSGFGEVPVRRSDATFR